MNGITWWARKAEGEVKPRVVSPMECVLRVV